MRHAHVLDKALKLHTGLGMTATEKYIPVLAAYTTQSSSTAVVLQEAKRGQHTKRRFHDGPPAGSPGWHQHTKQ